MTSAVWGSIDLTACVGPGDEHARRIAAVQVNAIADLLRLVGVGSGRSTLTIVLANRSSSAASAFSRASALVARYVSRPIAWL